MAKSYEPGAAARAAKRGFETVTKRRTAATAAKTAAAEAVQANTWTGLLKSGDVRGMLKKPGGILGALFLAQFLAGQLLRRGGGIAQQGLQQEAIEQQAGMNPEDAYYQAALPELSQERQMAQNALLQAILTGRGQQIQVPGERRI